MKDKIVADGKKWQSRKARWKPPTCMKEAATANATNPENNLKTTEQTIYN